jgi:hypothetical protein
MMQINLCLSGTNELKTAEIIVIGTGSITRGVVYGLSHVPGVSLRVAIIGRSHAKSSEIALIANARGHRRHNGHFSAIPHFPLQSCRIL